MHLQGLWDSNPRYICTQLAWHCRNCSFKGNLRSLGWVGVESTMWCTQSTLQAYRTWLGEPPKNSAVGDPQFSYICTLPSNIIQERYQAKHWVWTHSLTFLCTCINPLGHQCLAMTKSVLHSTKTELQMTINISNWAGFWTSNFLPLPRSICPLRHHKVPVTESVLHPH